VAPEASPVQAYGSSIPLSKAMSEEVLLAWQMNSEPLPRIHGGPVRVVVPGYIGARSVKWVNHITVQPGPSENYFQALDYRILPPETDPDTAAPGEGISLSSVPLNCDILCPGDGAEIPAGPVTIHGWALAADGRDIARVDVSLDWGHTWRQANLQPATSRWAWRLWSLTIEAQSGPMTLTARAWDDTGVTQPESPAALWNPRGYGNNAWAHVEVTVLPRRDITDGPRSGCPGSADTFAAPHPGSG
jgi:sulfite oxidase